VANGDVLLQPPGGQSSAGSISYKLLDSASGAGDNGQWVSAGEFDIGNVVIQGLATTATAEVDGSNDLTIPANSNHGAPIAAKTAAATATYVNIPSCPRWIKCRIVDAGTGTVNAIATLRSFAS